MEVRPGKGQWVMFSLPAEAARAAEKWGAWKTRSKQFCGIVAGASATPEGVVTLPPRIMLVNETGANVAGLVGMTVRDLWVTADRPPSGDEPAAQSPLAPLGYLGAAGGLALVDDREDVPPGRRPDAHPRDLRRPIAPAAGFADVEAMRRRIAELEGRLGIRAGPEAHAAEAAPREEEEDKSPSPARRRAGGARQGEG